MSVAEVVSYPKEALRGYDQLTYDEVISLMRAVAQPGQTELDNDTVEELNLLTHRLVELEGSSAMAEYDRYIGTEDRGLELPEDKLREQIEGKTILVSGGTGLIGSVLMKELSRYAPARLVSISRGEMTPQQVIPGAEYQNVDIRDAAGVEALMQALQPDLVYHVAADKYNHEAESRAQHTLSTNVLGTQNMLRAAEAAGVERFVYASTGKATRPYSADIYASSKKTGEWLVSEAAARGKMLCSAGRFTHVVDESSLLKKVNGWISDGQPLKLHSPDTWFYVQSAKESAHLLMNSGLEAEPGVLKVQTIRDLKIPIHLTKFGIGAIAKSGADVPIYFQGIEEGYEEKAWGGLYHPVVSSDFGPLISSLEAGDASASDTCDAIDAFPLRLTSTPELSEDFRVLQEHLAQRTDSTVLREASRRLSWSMLDARLDALPTETLVRSRKHIMMFSAIDAQSDEHASVNYAVARALDKRVQN